MPIGNEKYFWAYQSAMADLRISRRTLQRWLDDLDIHSLEFEDHLKVFLTLPHIVQLREYGKLMRTRNQPLINRYREALQTGNTRRMARIRKELSEIYSEMESTHDVTTDTVQTDFSDDFSGPDD